MFWSKENGRTSIKNNIQKRYCRIFFYPYYSSNKIQNLEPNKNLMICSNKFKSYLTLSSKTKNTTNRKKWIFFFGLVFTIVCSELVNKNNWRFFKKLKNKLFLPLKLGKFTSLLFSSFPSTQLWKISPNLKINSIVLTKLLTLQ